MATVPMFQLGKHLVSVIITGQSVSTAGVLSDSTAAASTATLTAVIDDMEEDSSPEHEEINSLNSTRRNQVLVSDGTNLNLGVIKVNNGGDPQPLRTLIQSYDYFKVVAVEGTNASARTATGYYTRGSYGHGFRGRGKQVARLSLVECDPGSAQVVIS